MADLFTTSEEAQYIINNVNRDEQQAIMLHLSRDPRILQDQIRFLNGDSRLVYKPGRTPINNSIAASEKNISADIIAKDIYDLGKINSLTGTVAKTTIGATKFLDKQIDNLGSTILNAIDKVTNAAEDGVDFIESKLQEWGSNIAEKERSFVNKSYPCTTWAGDMMRGISSELVDDIGMFNTWVSKNRLLNMPGDAFNSVRHIAFAIRGEIEKLIDFAHQMFAGLTSAMIKLKRQIKRIVKAITTFCLTLIEGLIPTDFLKSIADSVNSVIQVLGETFNTIVNGPLGLQTVENSFQGLQDEVTKMAEHPLLYVFEQVGAEPFVNLPLLDQIKKLEKIQNDFVNNKIFTEFLKFSDKFTLENLIKTLPKGAQETLRILSEISSNAHGFIGNGIRNYARRKILKNKRNAFIGKLNSVGVNFTLSVPYHYSTSPAYRSAPLITFKPLLTDNSGSVTVDKYGNRIVTNYLSFTSTRLY